MSNDFKTDGGLHGDPPFAAARGSAATLREMADDLIAAGWQPWKHDPTVWQCPTGGLWRGPALAWHVMRKLPWPPNTILSDSDNTSKTS